MLFRSMKPTLINCITACSPGMAKGPATYETDREAVEAALSCIGLTPAESSRVVHIKNTLMVGELEVSEAYAAEVRRSTASNTSRPIAGCARTGFRRARKSGRRDRALSSGR